MSPAIPAATLVLLRDRASGPPELLMVERARTLAFAAGAWVFPGGRIEPDDATVARGLSPGLADGDARVAAIRETLEETGIPIGFQAGPSQVATMRQGLAEGAAFSQVAAGIQPDLTALVPFARWRPAHKPSRVFDTLFYIAAAPPGAVASVDGTENSRLAWTTAADLLARADAGEATIIYPTRRNLERLARFADFAEARDDARRHPIRTITPFVEVRDGVEHLCIPADLGYPVTGEPLTDAVRG